MMVRGCLGFRVIALNYVHMMLNFTFCSGYLKYCIVFADVDNNQKYTTGVDPASLTNLTGGWTLTLKGRNQSSSNLFVQPSTQIVNRTVSPSTLSMCYDTTTLLTLVIPLAAPAGSTVISPLSTLLVFAPSGVSTAAMRKAITTGFNLSSSFVMGTTDAYKEYLVKGTPGAFTLVLAEQLVSSVVVQTSYMLAKNIQDVPKVATAVFQSVALIVYTQYITGQPVSNLASALSTLSSGRHRVLQNSVKDSQEGVLSTREILQATSSSSSSSSSSSAGSRDVAVPSVSPPIVFSEATLNVLLLIAQQNPVVIALSAAAASSTVTLPTWGTAASEEAPSSGGAAASSSSSTSYLSPAVQAAGVPSIAALASLASECMSSEDYQTLTQVMIFSQTSMSDWLNQLSTSQISPQEFVQQASPVMISKLVSATQLPSITPSSVSQGTGASSNPAAGPSGIGSTSSTGTAPASLPLTFSVAPVGTGGSGSTGSSSGAGLTMLMSVGISVGVALIAAGGIAVLYLRRRRKGKGNAVEMVVADNPTFLEACGDSVTDSVGDHTTMQRGSQHVQLHGDWADGCMRQQGSLAETSGPAAEEAAGRPDKASAEKVEVGVLTPALLCGHDDGVHCNKRKKRGQAKVFENPVYRMYPTGSEGTLQRLDSLDGLEASGHYDADGSPPEAEGNSVECLNGSGNSGGSNPNGQPQSTGARGGPLAPEGGDTRPSHKLSTPTMSVVSNLSYGIGSFLWNQQKGS
ncbi:hypothetical protein CEUSTIGMA_g11850.t1 [Chlamydomonas eustigma]|uniref:Uncharacterized protein n=1 Tax=Chlamydomonas eustigma TaxID=1157962 RepID=A0A250XNQ7_9CHLO|nr:hypothetical protein CEUSTIGMA_g11850.t1 [Chlamydomonas eustigma]|eukprot:GAX84430.1 hypothetical protein CEUSTIGMA_g11850.t1 [Chlamydomonas eustigma]